MMNDAKETSTDKLALELSRFVAHSNTVVFSELLPLLRKLLGRTEDIQYSPYALLALLLARPEPEAATLALRFHAIIMAEALRMARARQATPSADWCQSPLLTHLPHEMPVGWRNDAAALATLKQVVQLQRDLAFLQSKAPDMSGPLNTIATALANHLAVFQKTPMCWDLIPLIQLWSDFPLPPDTTLPSVALQDALIEEDSYLKVLATRATENAGQALSPALKELVAWPSASAADYLRQICVGSPARQAFVMQALALRTQLEYSTWTEWLGWLKRTTESFNQLRSEAALLATQFQSELRLLWLRQQADVSNPALISHVEAAVVLSAQRDTQPSEFVRRWDYALMPSEARRFVETLPLSAGVAKPQTTFARPEAMLAKPEVILAKPKPTPVKPERLEPKLPASVNVPPVRIAEAKPTVWDSHIQPFLAANWYIIAGLLMVVAGASLLAYFTWDKSAFVRYLFLPLILGAFTAGLAEIGLRLARRHKELRVTGSFLLGGAVCLLPVNFIILCRAGTDPLAARYILPALGFYSLLSGLGLCRWCGAIRRELRLLLGVPLLVVNLLAVLGDMPGIRDAIGTHSATWVPLTITAAVLLLLAATYWFLLRVLDINLLEEKIVPWFFGVTMVATTLQVAAWRYFHLQLSPHPQDYALMTILIGAMLLRWERRACELRNMEAVYGGESFMGYAGLLLGILMAAGHPWLRLVALLLAGLIWLAQAPRRPGVVHYWIGVTLCLLAGASVGLLEVFPKSRELNLLPALGLALSLIVGALRALSGRRGEARLRQVALEIQPPLLIQTAIITVLSQYHLRSAPWQAGLVLLAVAIFFGVRATREKRLDWIFIAAACAGLALPYLGCADMVRYQFTDNTLALGFGVLSMVWLIISRRLQCELWRLKAGQITTCFAALGIFGLCLRLLLAHLPDISVAELAGTALLIVILAIAAWQSRNQIPSLMGAVLLVVILPLFHVPSGVIPEVFYVGTGLVSAACALALTLGSFVLRREELRRNCEGLFSVSVWASVAWLSVKSLALQLPPHLILLPFVLSMLLLSVSGYVAALFFRQHTAGLPLFHASWVLLGVGMALGCDMAGCKNVEMVQYPLLWTSVALTLLLGAEILTARRWAWAEAFLVRPRFEILSVGNVALALLIAGLVTTRDLVSHPQDLQWLALFVGAQMVWHSFRCAQRRFGAVLFLLAVVWLSGFDDASTTFSNLSIFLLTTLLADFALEFIPKVRTFLNPLRAPFLVGATLLAVVLSGASLLALHVVSGGLLKISFAQADLLLLVASLVLVARAQACAVLAVPAISLAYLLLHLPCSVNTLFRPWRLAVLALVFCLLPYLGRLLSKRYPRLLYGWGPQAPDVAAGPQSPWFILPGLALASGAAFLQVSLSTLGPLAESRWIQITPPFATIIAFALAATYWRRGALWLVAECLLPLANLFALSVLWGQVLMSHQLMPIHIIGIAAVVTIAEFSALRYLVLQVWRPPMTDAARWLHWGCSALAGVTLILLGMNYMTDPDLAKIPACRFLVSGVLALSAGVYFRAAARRPENLQATDGTTMETLWHVALGVAVWCGALMVPALRTPHAALYVLALPSLVCWLAAEVFLILRTPNERNLLTGNRFSNSAIAFALLVLVLYIFRLPSQLVFFPTSPLSLQFYHTGAAVILLLSFLLFRLRGLTGSPWVAQVGGLALIPSVYFLVTWLPGLSPFTFPMAAAWTAIVLAHLLVLLSYQQSPLRSFIQYIGSIGAEEWHEQRRQCGLFLIIATHVVVVSGLLQGYRTHSADLTPLLAALTSVLVHLVIVGVPWAGLYRIIAAIELVLALHVDFLLPSGLSGLIPARQVVWFLLASWLGGALFWQRVKRPMDVRVIWATAGWLSLLCGAHLVYHGLSTGSGLLIAAGVALAGLLTPMPEENAPASRPFAFLALGIPLWLSYFGMRWLTGEELFGFRSLLVGLFAVLATGMLVRRVDSTLIEAAARLSCRRLAHDVLALCRREGDTLARVLLGVVFAGLMALTFLHDDARHGTLGLMLSLAFVWGLCSAAWFREGQLRDGSLPYTLSVLSLAGSWILLRRLLFQHFSFWTYEYDIWLSIGASVAFSAAKRLVKHKQPGLARTMTGTVWLIPALQCFWLIYTRMNADLTLLVIGIQAILFAWHGGGKKDSPYNAVSMLGFVGFVCLLFWSKFDLRCVQAYTIPCGIGVLGLVWLFGEQMTTSLRSAVRSITVVIMIGSCGYYALLDDTYPIAFHFIMLTLCLIVMALGPLLRVQLYLYIGFAGFAMDLIALVIKQFHSLNHSLQMMGIGALLLLLGIAVVAGAVFYKTRHEIIMAFVGKVRAKLEKWE
jgi:hypothetical protein